MNFMLLAGIVFAMGDYLGLSYGEYYYYWVGILFCSILSGIFCYFWKAAHRSFIISCSLIIMMLGAILGAKANVPLPSFWLALERRPGYITGDIVAGSGRQGQGQSWSFLMQEIRTGKCLKVKVKNAFPGQSQPDYGRVRLFGQIEPLTGLANPGAFNSRFYGKVNNIWGKTTVDSRHITRLSGSGGWQRYLSLCQKKIKNILTGAMGKTDSAILKGMTLGGTEDIPEDTLDDFSTVGIIHLLAVSGTHVAVLTGALLYIFGLMGIPIRPASLGTATLLIFYGFLCGFKPSVLRAVLMGLFYLGGNWEDNAGDRGAILGAALLSLLMYKPWWLFSIGFQLSFLATAGLIFLLPKLKECLQKYLPAYLAMALAIPIAAQLPMLPFLFFYFHRLSLVAILANLIVVPLLNVVLIVTMLGLVLSAFVPIMGKVFLISASQLLGVALWLIEHLSHLSFAAVNISPWPVSMIIAYYLLLFIWFKLYPFEHFSKFYLTRITMACLLVLGLGHGAAYFITQPFTAYFLSVGQGDSTILVTPHKKVIIIDTGGLGKDYDTGKRIIVPTLRYLGLDKVDIMLLSHGHHDHAGGAAGVAKCLPVDRVLLPRETPSGDIEALFRTLGPRTKTEIMWTGQEIWLDECRLKMLDIPLVVGDNKNESCAIVQASYLGQSILFTGDALAEQELKVVDKNLASTVLKVSHHGPASSSCEEFLRQVNPSVAIISCGRKNRFGHPHKEVLNRLAGKNIKILRTDELGAIRLGLDGDKMSCSWYYK